MISTADLKKLARARIKDAKALLKAGRYDGAIYICGYAVEVGLKLRICKTLKWASFPEKTAEFSSYKSFKTHDLDVLLHLSGIEARIKKTYLFEWSVVGQWDPETRYNPVGGASQADAVNMIASTEKLVKIL
jgi:hypothetical protein